MMRCLINPSLWSADEITLAPDESHHLIRVLRIRPGEHVGLFTGCGHTAEAVYVAARQDRAQVRILPDTRREIPPPTRALTLIQAIPKHALMDGIVQKAVELGIGAIQPLITERVIIRLASDESEKRRERWQKIALEAARQCGAAWIPNVLPVQTLPAMAKELAHFNFCFVGSLHADAIPFREAATQARARLAPRGAASSIALVIGPEGDFTEEETLALRDAGAYLVAFGKLVLRVETAALYGMSLLRYEFAD